MFATLAASALALATAAAAPTHDCTADAPGARGGALLARVLDRASGLPVPGATVVAAWATPGDAAGAGFGERRGRTDAAGRIVLCPLPVGVAVTAWAQAGATRTPLAELRAAGDDTVSLVFHLSAQAVRELEEVRVTARAPEAREHEFLTRRKRSGGGGQFMDRERIASLGRKSVTDLARSFSSVSMADDGTGRGPVLSTTRAGRACPINVFLDGTPVNQMALDGIVTPDLLVGIEYYAGFASPPARYSSFDRSQCGTMLLWTKTDFARREERAQGR